MIAGLIVGAIVMALLFGLNFLVSKSSTSPVADAILSNMATVLYVTVAVVVGGTYLLS